MWWLKVGDDSGRKRNVAPVTAVTDLGRQERKWLKAFQVPMWCAWVAVPTTIGFVAAQVLAICTNTNVAGPAQLWFIISGSTFVAGIYTIAITVLVREFLGMRARSLARAWVRIGRCAWCGYDLQHTGVEQDGLKHCPECTGCWRIGVPPLAPDDERAGN